MLKVEPQDKRRNSGCEPAALPRVDPAVPGRPIFAWNRLEQPLTSVRIEVLHGPDL